MENVWLIRAGIFFTAGLIAVLFTKPVMKLQFIVVNFAVEKLRIGFMRHLLVDEERVIRGDRIIGYWSIVISILLLLYSIQ